MNWCASAVVARLYHAAVTPALSTGRKNWEHYSFAVSAGGGRGLYRGRDLKLHATPKAKNHQERMKA
jgi:hypothetical protein